MILRGRSRHCGEFSTASRGCLSTCYHILVRIQYRGRIPGCSIFYQVRQPDAYAVEREYTYQFVSLYFGLGLTSDLRRHQRDLPESD